MLDSNVLENEMLICADVDDTIVLHREPEEGEDTVLIKDPYDDRYVRLVVHKPHMKLLRDRMTRGCAVILWSQSGYAWAKAVADALDFKPTLIASKPFMVLDDLPVQEWMNNRVYMDPNSNWGKFTEDNLFGISVEEWSKGNPKAVNLTEVFKGTHVSTCGSLTEEVIDEMVEKTREYCEKGIVADS